MFVRDELRSKFAERQPQSRIDGLYGLWFVFRSNRFAFVQIQVWPFRQGNVYCAPLELPIDFTPESNAHRLAHSRTGNPGIQVLRALPLLPFDFTDDFINA